jgi:hypothetical protein
MQPDVVEDRQLTARIVFHTVMAENEPLGENVELRLDESGFRQPQIAGNAGESTQPMRPADVAAALTETFDGQAIAALLSQLCDLQRYVLAANERPIA